MQFLCENRQIFYSSFRHQFLCESVSPSLAHNSSTSKISSFKFSTSNSKARLLSLPSHTVIGWNICRRKFLSSCSALTHRNAGRKPNNLAIKLGSKTPQVRELCFSGQLRNECPISQSQICYRRWNGAAFLSHRKPSHVSQS